MDERSYVEQKQPSWNALSESLDQIRKLGVRSLTRARLESLGAQYRAAVSDLSFARTQGASDDLTGYLNELAGRAHGVLYASESARAGDAIAFLVREFPRLFRSTYRYTLAAAIMFFISWGIAAYVVVSDPGVGKSLVPDNISRKKGSDGIVSAPDPAMMSSFIMTNNVKVGIVSFAGGITAGVVTVLVMCQNGANIGAIATAAAPLMGYTRFWSYILPHGIIELMAIFICGGAGLMIAGAMIAPGNLRRSDAIRVTSGRALRLFAGTIPFYIVAATIEGFITPSVLPAWSKLTFAGITAIGLIMYLGFAGTTTSPRS
ncbi:MAG: stage II sporulation protein M [Armatimonadetes bacterium]|nr:stage II sporulation protein M [Armatimonadota bacterium]